jgi:hypothetical protein
MLQSSERGIEDHESLEQQVVFLRRRADEWKQRALHFEREVEELQNGVKSPPRQDQRRFEYQVCSSPKLDEGVAPTCYSENAVEARHVDMAIAPKMIARQTTCATSGRVARQALASARYWRVVGER